MTQDVDDLDVGFRLKSLREIQRISQRELSRRSGVANATISQIESGDLNPTVSMLKRVLVGMHMSLSDFFNYDPVRDEKKIFFSAGELIEINRGGVSYLQIGGNLQHKAIQLLHEKYEPGANIGRRPISHEGEECGYVLRGELVVTVGTESRTLKAGEGYYFNSELPHSFNNKGTEVCELVSACTPPTF